jgi:uncharacterized protein YecT (DUF1311 family)
MKIIETGALALMLTLGAIAACAAAAPPYPVRDCGNLTVQLELNQCAAANYEAADTTLNKVYQRVMAQQDDAAAKNALKDAERAWIAYRDKECAFEVGPQQSGGSIWPMEMSNCLEDKTAARIGELSKLDSCTAGVAACAQK